MGAIPERAYMAWLRSCLSLRERSFRWLITQHETAERVFFLAKDGLRDEEERRINAAEKSELQRYATIDKVESVWRDLQKKRIGVVLRSDAFYPPGILDLPDAPYLLYMRGQRDTLLKADRLCVIGTRDASEYGRSTAYTLSRQWAESEGCVVSGLALGIDTAAHQGAMAGCSRCSTIAVLAGGLDKSQPRANESIFEEIIENGLLISENPPGYKIQKWSIPYRNRIMAALCQGVLLIEAKHKSGTQHTISAALDLGREVFAVPGRIDGEGSQFPNQLIRDGAVICNEIDDIIDHYPEKKKQSGLGARVLFQAKTNFMETNTKPDTPALQQTNQDDIESEKKEKIELIQNEVQALIIAALAQQSLSLEELVIRCERSVPVVLRELSLLMSRGLIDMDESGSRYQL